MKWLTFKAQKTPGFRFNLADILLILVILASSIAWYYFTKELNLYLLPLYVGGTFFLFCNVFRVGNKVEPFWYLSFLLAVFIGLKFQEYFWIIVIGACEPIKLAIILFRIVKGPYVGIFHTRLNKFLLKEATKS